MCLPCAHTFPQAFCFCHYWRQELAGPLAWPSVAAVMFLCLSCCERVGVLVVNPAVFSTSCRTNRAYRGAIAESGTEGTSLTFLNALHTAYWTYCEEKTLCFPKTTGLFTKMLVFPSPAPGSRRVAAATSCPAAFVAVSVWQWGCRSAGLPGEPLLGQSPHLRPTAAW